MTMLALQTLHCATDLRQATAGFHPDLFAILFQNLGDSH
jgi:hypothetical protein